MTFCALENPACHAVIFRISRGKKKKKTHTHAVNKTKCCFHLNRFLIGSDSRDAAAERRGRVLYLDLRSQPSCRE